MIVLLKIQNDNKEAIRDRDKTDPKKKLCHYSLESISRNPCFLGNMVDLIIKLIQKALSRDTLTSMHLDPKLFPSSLTAFLEGRGRGVLPRILELFSRKIQAINLRTN